MQINGGRLRTDIEANAAFGEVDAPAGRGRTVLTGTDANRAARDHLCSRLEDAEFAVEIDAIGNILGTWTPESADPEAAPVVAGSHLDSVPEGGIFDGPLGVYGALEAVRTIQEADLEPARPIAVVSFTEEEGTRFGGGVLGSSVATGRVGLEGALALTDGDGVALEDALSEMGYRGDGLLDPRSWEAFLELHVEQDTRLETAGVSAGVVETITGINHSHVRFVGEANHAGATPMDERVDALAAASEFVLALERAGNEAAEAGENTAVATVGKCDVRPNGTNVVPGAVDVGVDVRDIDYGVMESILERAADSLERIEAERGVETSWSEAADVEPASMSERCRQALIEGAAGVDLETTSLHSGAAHDAMNVSRVTDAGMLFAPSRDGISHNPLEWTDWDDCADATAVLAAALAELSGS